MLPRLAKKYILPATPKPVAVPAFAIVAPAGIFIVSPDLPKPIVAVLPSPIYKALLPDGVSIVIVSNLLIR